jgi:hypothetical protein
LSQTPVGTKLLLQAAAATALQHALLLLLLLLCLHPTPAAAAVAEDGGLAPQLNRAPPVAVAAVSLQPQLQLPAHHY